jgi:hypothetical protein
MSQLAETDTTRIKVSHVSSLSATELAASYNA